MLRCTSNYVTFYSEKERQEDSFALTQMGGVLKSLLVAGATSFCRGQEGEARRLMIEVSRIIAALDVTQCVFLRRADEAPIARQLGATAPFFEATSNDMRSSTSAQPSSRIGTPRLGALSRSIEDIRRLRSSSRGADVNCGSGPYLLRSLLS